MSFLQKRQIGIVQKIAPYLNKDGHLLYITCSVFKSENEDVLKMVRPLSESMRGLYDSSKSGKMKELYCVEKVINLTKQVDIIANALAARNK